MENLVETEWKFQKLKHIGAFACIFGRRVLQPSIFYVFHVELPHAAS
jgi:hypothetical protein